jgi:hypothetical protein
MVKLPSGAALSGVVLSLPKRVVLEFQSANVDPHHGLICIRRQFSVRHVKAEDIQVAVVELFVVLVVELAQRCGLIGLECGNSAIEHGFCFCRSAGLLGQVFIALSAERYPTGIMGRRNAVGDLFVSRMACFPDGDFITAVGKINQSGVELTYMAAQHQGGENTPGKLPQVKGEHGTRFPLLRTCRVLIARTFYLRKLMPFAVQ